jgi:putative tryptophan/tyrosine transport system substrate-binding protein
MRRCFLGIPGGAAAGSAATRNTRAVDRADTSDRRADGAADNDQEAQARVVTFRDVQKLGWIEGRNIRIDARWSTSNAVDRTRTPSSSAICRLMFATRDLSESRRGG